MSKDVVEALLNSIDTTTDVGIRDYILWELIYRTALRISEALSIKLKHINLKAEKPFVTIVGKRYKVRSAYLGKTLTENLKRYIRNNFGKKYDEDSFLFYSRIHGKKTPITVKGAELRLKKYAMLANLTCKDVPVNLHPHMLRHARATHLLESGWNIIQVSKMLGHEDVSTTMRYLDITEEQTLSAMISIESEAEKKIEKKWDSNSLLSFFGKTK
jgi:site-specific recombinase XerD